MRPLCAAAMLSVLIGTSCKPPESLTETAKINTPVSQKLKETKGWHLAIETDRMDNTPQVSFEIR